MITFSNILINGVDSKTDSIEFNKAIKNIGDMYDLPCLAKGTDVSNKYKIIIFT